MIKYICVCICGMVLLLAGEAIAREWYEGGTLPSATVEKFCAASPQNRLATAGDWVAGTTDSEQLRKVGFSALKDAADDVQECVVKGGEGIAEVQQTKALELGVMCMSMLKKTYPWMLTKK